jgi:hypothetical protein
MMLKLALLSSLSVGQQTMAEFTLKNWEDSEYATSIFVGSKRQPISLVVSTTEPITWFAGEFCLPSQCTNQRFLSTES